MSRVEFDEQPSRTYATLEKAGAVDPLDAIDDALDVLEAEPGEAAAGRRCFTLGRWGIPVRTRDGLDRGDSRKQRGQVAQRVVEMVWCERREMNALPGIRPYRRPVIGKCDLSLVRTELGQVITPDPAAELELACCR